MNDKKIITAEDVIEICNGELICGNLDAIFENFCKDTREIKTGDIYVGIKGENHDGNEFYDEALEKGAKGCILQGIIIPEHIKEKYKDKVIILVDNTIRALQKLASYKRNMYDIPVVAVTGSVGKTSTKDIIASVMSKEFKVLKTEGNYNSQLGLALTVLKLKDHTAMVVEMGMNHLGEISTLSQIARPTVAVITNVGTAHIGILGSRANILKAKLEILDGLSSDGTLVINNDNDLLHEWYLDSGSHKYEIETFGMENVSSYMPKNQVINENGSTYNIDVNGKNYNVKIDIGGNHFILNSLCAITVGRLFNIQMESILDGISNFELTKRRMQVEKRPNNVVIINDCYNANYDSMKAAIEYLGKIPTGKKIAVLGDMLELGEFSEDLHRRVGEEVAKNNTDILVTVGEEAKYIAEEAKQEGLSTSNIYEFEKNSEAQEFLKELTKEGNINILLKASNGMKFQEIFDFLMNL